MLRPSTNPWLSRCIRAGIYESIPELSSRMLRPYIIRPLAKIARTGKMPIPLLANFSCGVGVPPAPEFDEKECFSRGLLLNRLRSRDFLDSKKLKRLTVEQEITVTLV
jgi:hypothetical protein